MGKVWMVWKVNHLYYSPKPEYLLVLVMESLFYVTGTYHGAHVYATSEGEARRIFHNYYNGESIIHLIKAY